MRYHSQSALACQLLYLILCSSLRHLVLCDRDALLKYVGKRVLGIAFSASESDGGVQDLYGVFRVVPLRR